MILTIWLQKIITAACDLSVTSPLNSKILSEAGVTAGAAAHAGPLSSKNMRPMMLSVTNDLGWICIPLVVESYGAWGKEALDTFSMLASRLATSSSRPKSRVSIRPAQYLHLVRANVRAILSRLSCPHLVYI